MAEIVNLRQRRKQEARQERDKAAAANREKFGEPKASRALREGTKVLAEKALEAHRREPE